MALALDRDGFERFDAILAAERQGEAVAVFETLPSERVIESGHFESGLGYRRTKSAFVLDDHPCDQAFIVSSPHSVREGRSYYGVAVSVTCSTVWWWGREVLETEFHRTRRGKLKPVHTFDRGPKRPPTGYRARRVGFVAEGRAERTAADVAILARVSLHGFGEGPAHAG